MTQTPRGFDPNNVPPSQPGAFDATAAGQDAEAASPGTGMVPGTPAAAPADGRDVDAGAEAPETPAPAPERQVTRAGMVWAAVASALVVLILLIAFILQNQEYVQVKFFGLQGSVPLGIALLIAAVGGGVLVAIAGAARIIQLRVAARRSRATR